MARFSELLEELARSERHLAEGQARLARQAELVCALDANDHYTTFSAKRLVVMMANLNDMERRREQIVRELAVSQENLQPDPSRRRCPFHVATMSQGANRGRWKR